MCSCFSFGLCSCWHQENCSVWCREAWKLALLLCGGPSFLYALDGGDCGKQVEQWKAPVGTTGRRSPNSHFLKWVLRGVCMWSMCVLHLTFVLKCIQIKIFYPLLDYFFWKKKSVFFMEQWYLSGQDFSL